MFSHAPWLVISVFALTAVWLVLVATFFRRLRLAHPAQFDALGRPSFNGGVIQVLRFIYTRRHRALNDRLFSLLCDAMLIVFSAIVLLFLVAMSGLAPYVPAGAN